MAGAVAAFFFCSFFHDIVFLFFFSHIKQILFALFSVMATESERKSDNSTGLACVFLSTFFFVVVANVEELFFFL